MYSRQHPSEHYRRSVQKSQEFHRTHKTFTGAHIFQSFFILDQIIKETGSQSILDYGCGKGRQLNARDIALLVDPQAPRKEIFPSWLDALGIQPQSYFMFDPCVPEYSALPQEKADGVVAIDVLGAVPEIDIPWVLEEMFSFARCFVYAQIGCYRGGKNWMNDDLSLFTVQPWEWWVDQWHSVARRFPTIQWDIRLEREPHPSTHRRFGGKGDQCQELPRWWGIVKPHEQ